MRVRAGANISNLKRRMFTDLRISYTHRRPFSPPLYNLNTKARTSSSLRRNTDSQTHELLTVVAGPHQLLRPLMGLALGGTAARSRTPAALRNWGPQRQESVSWSWASDPCATKPRQAHCDRRDGPRRSTQRHPAGQVGAGMCTTHARNQKKIKYSNEKFYSTDRMYHPLDRSNHTAQLSHGLLLPLQIDSQQL